MSSLPKEHDTVLPTEAADLRLLRFVSCAHDNYSRHVDLAQLFISINSTLKIRQNGTTKPELLASYLGKLTGIYVDVDKYYQAVLNMDYLCSDLEEVENNVYSLCFFAKQVGGISSGEVVLCILTREQEAQVRRSESPALFNDGSLTVWFLIPSVLPLLSTLQACGYDQTPHTLFCPAWSLRSGSDL